MMEIGSFIEMQFPKGMEYYKGEANIARLNSGRCAIWHAFRVMSCDTIWLPYYQCDTVREFLGKKGVSIKYYHIDRNFMPTDISQGENEAVLLVNYYGIMSNDRMRRLSSKYKHVIIDNSQAFFNEPIEGCMNVYSCRKFVGVPDGAYVIGRDAETYVSDYEKCYSSDTALFLLQRIEYGCEGRAYKSRQLNEHRIDTEDCMRMSGLTYAILDGTDYNVIIEKRKENFQIAFDMFQHTNCLNLTNFYDQAAVPMVYPLVVENETLLDRLQRAKHFQGHWWSYLCEEMPHNTFEYWLSRYGIPITIDQRYGQEELDYINRVVNA